MLNYKEVVSMQVDTVWNAHFHNGSMLPMTHSNADVVAAIFEVNAESVYDDIETGFKKLVEDYFKAHGETMIDK